MVGNLELLLHAGASCTMICDLPRSPGSLANSLHFTDEAGGSRVDIWCQNEGIYVWHRARHRGGAQERPDGLMNEGVAI